MRDLNQIIADNGNDPTPAMDTHNLTGRAICRYCNLPAYAYGMCEGHYRLGLYDPTREIAANE